MPDEIHQVRAVPRTLSAKKLEVPVKKILTGTPVDQAAAKGALANPESLAAFADRLAQQPPAEHPAGHPARPRDARRGAAIARSAGGQR